MKYVYGPLKSRRLGYSLGINLVPSKVCQFDCVYCQLKRTTQKTMARRRYFDEEEILEDVRNFFRYKPQDCQVDHVTFSGSGEPTLHRSIGRLIRAVKKITPVSVVVITNSAALVDARVRREIAAADIIVPSLDAVTQDIFEKIDRPEKGIKISRIIRALTRLRVEFKGKIWLEVMLVRGVNDSDAYLKKIRDVVKGLSPDKIQINSPVRPPSESWVKSPTKKTLESAKKIFGVLAEVI